MFIEISDELVVAAEQDDSNAIAMLEKLALAIKYQKHIVFAQLPQLDKIIALPSLDAMSKSQFLKIKSSYSEIGQLLRKLDFKACVKMSGDNCRARNCIYVNASNSEKLEVYEETHLLTENLQDGEFFEYIVQQYVKTLGCSWPICYMPQMGGGSTMAKVYKMEIDKGQHFCLAILDSDKKWPSAKKGDTCDKLKSEDKDKYLGDTGSNGQYAYNCSYYAMEDLCELENLIPMEVLKATPNIKEMDLLKMSFDMSYHDMKEGLLASKIKEGDYQNYLHTIYASYPDLVNTIDFYAECRKVLYAKDKDSFEKDCGKFKLVGGLGSKVMEHVLQDSQTTLKNVDFSKLSVSQQSEWINIGKKVFEWCCRFDGGASS